MLIVFLLSCSPIEAQYTVNVYRSSTTDTGIANEPTTDSENEQETAIETGQTQEGYGLQPLALDNVNGASIWNGLAPLEDGYIFSTMVVKDLTIRKMDLEFSTTSTVVTIANGDDIDAGDHITDHATLRVGETLYFAKSQQN